MRKCGCSLTARHEAFQMRSKGEWQNAAGYYATGTQACAFSPLTQSRRRWAACPRPAWQTRCNMLATRVTGQITAGWLADGVAVVQVGALSRSGKAPEHSHMPEAYTPSSLTQTNQCPCAHAHGLCVPMQPARVRPCSQPVCAHAPGPCAPMRPARVRPAAASLTSIREGSYQGNTRLTPPVSFTMLVQEVPSPVLHLRAAHAGRDAGTRLYRDACGSFLLLLSKGREARNISEQARVGKHARYRDGYMPSYSKGRCGRCAKRSSACASRMHPTAPPTCCPCRCSRRGAPGPGSC